MKKIFLSILTAVVALTATAQDINVKGLIVCKNDGTRDTIILAKKTSSIGSSFYGKENPVDNDYIQLSFTLTDYNEITYSCSLTNVGRNAPFSIYGIMFSSNHIDSIPQNHFYSGEYGELLYFVDTRQWIRPDYRQYVRQKYEQKIFASSFKKYFNLPPGQQCYARAYYLLDDKAYFSSEIELRVAKTRSSVCEYYYSDYANFYDAIIVKIDAAKIFSEHADLFGTDTYYKRQLLTQYISRAIREKEYTELQAMATKTEECDDGTLYILDELPADVLAKALQLINDDIASINYLQANKDNVYTEGTNTTSFGTSNCNPKMVTSDEKWGIRDNQYLVTVPTMTTSRPRIAFELNHLVQAGKTYDVTLTFAPNTENETDSLDVYFYVTIANLKDDGTMPQIADGERFGKDTLISKKPVFIAKPMEQKVMTMPYMAKNFTDKLYLQLDHIYSFTSSANRRRYGREFRVVGVEVKPHEE